MDTNRNRPKRRQDSERGKATEHGAHPKTGWPYKLLKIGQRICPECRGDLEPGGESCLICGNCDAAFQVGSVP